jgi:hypothetical protein
MSSCSVTATQWTAFTTILHTGKFTQPKQVGFRS